jgi:hypothetical protein
MISDQQRPIPPPKYTQGQPKRRKTIPSQRNHRRVEYQQLSQEKDPQTFNDLTTEPVALLPDASAKKRSQAKKYRDDDAPAFCSSSLIIRNLEFLKAETGKEPNGLDLVIAVIEKRQSPWTLHCSG